MKPTYPKWDSFNNIMKGFAHDRKLHHNKQISDTHFVHIELERTLPYNYCKGKCEKGAL